VVHVLRNDWFGCYKPYPKEAVVPESFTHPAKMAWDLTHKIFVRLEELGLPKRSKILEPFAGIFTTGLVGGLRGYQVMGMELESRFHILSLDNLEKNRHIFCQCEGGKDVEKSKVLSVSGRVSSRPFGNTEGSTKEGQTLLFASLPDSVEQGEGVTKKDTIENVESGQQRESSDGEERPLEGGTLCSPGRLYSNSDSPKCGKDGTRIGDGETSGPKDKQGRSGSSQKRESARQPTNKSSSDDDRGTSPLSQFGRPELEKKAKTCPACGKTPKPVVVQGDSTKDLLAAFGGEKFQAVVGSPAYSETPLKNNLTQEQFEKKQKRITASGSKWKRPRPTGNFAQTDYGKAPGQMANLKEGDFQAVISSPPYADIDRTGGISQRPNQSEEARRKGWDRNPKSAAAKQDSDGYGKTDGQVSQLPEGDFSAVVSSPPYEEIRMDGGKIGKEGQGGMRPYSSEPVDAWRTTRDQKNLGNNSPDTYWQACRDIYFNCFLLLKSGGFIALVVKDFVRKKKRVPLCDQTWELLQAVGFEPVERNRAWLVEGREAATFFEANYSVKRERKSFFRRLAEKKGSPKIDWEEVLICKKP